MRENFGSEAAADQPLTKAIYSDKIASCSKMASSTTDDHLKQIYSFALELLRPRKVTSVDPLNNPLDFLKDEVQKELGYIYDVAPTLAGSAKRAFVHLNEHEHEEALECFRQAEQTATAHVKSASSFKEKLWAFRILLFSTFYIDGYFSSFYDFESLQDDVEQIFEKLMALPEVQDALTQELEPRSPVKVMTGSGSKGRRRKVLAPVGAIHTVLREAVKRDFLIKKVDGKYGNMFENISILRSARDGDLKLIPIGSRDVPVHSMLLDRNCLYVGLENGNIEAWNATSNAKFGMLSEHKEKITSLAASAYRLYSASTDNTIRVWHRATLEEVAVLKGHTDWVHCIALHGDRLYSASEDKTLRVWNLTFNTEIVSEQTEEHAGAVLSVVVTEDKVFSGSRDMLVKVYDPATMKVTAILKDINTPVVSLAVHSELLFAGGEDGSIHVWNTATLDKLTTLLSHRGAVHTLCATGDRLYSGSADRRVIVWDIDIMKKSKTDSNEKADFQGHTGAVRAVTAVGGRLYTASEDKTVKLWDLNPWAEEEK